MLYCISTHDLTKRSTCKIDSIALVVIFQLTTSRRGRRLRSIVPTLVISISTHDLTKRSTCHAHKHPLTGLTFQLTTSRRGRQVNADPLPCVGYFNSRPHEEVDAAFRHPSQLRSISTHDLTKRSTLLQKQSLTLLYYFNSRPHEEVDTACP